MKQEVLHYPRLDTVLMIEETLKKAEEPISKSELQRRLPKQVMRQTLNLILGYLEEKGMILMGKKGVLWIFAGRKELSKFIKRGTEI
jgi:hypothetical protein